MSSTADTKRKGRSVGKENAGGKDIFNTEALDDEVVTQGSIAKELKGSIFTPKIVDGPRVRRSTAVVNQQPPKPTVAPKKAEPKAVKSTVVAVENKVIEKKDNKTVEKAVKKDNKPKVMATATKTKAPKPAEPLMDSIDDDEDEDMEFSGSKSFSSRPAVLPSVIAMELEAISAIKPKPQPEPRKQEVPTVVKSPVKVVPIVHELPKPTIAVQQPAVMAHSPSDIPVLVDYKAAYETMREKFERLNLLRTTEAEKLLNDYKKTFAAQKQSADQLINGLKNENERLKAQIQQISTNSRRDSNVSTLSSNSTTSTADQLQHLSRQVDLYRELCGMEMEVVGEFAWKCVLAGRLGALHFNLHFDEDTESFEYVPQVAANSPLVSVLPAYLLEDISFGPDQLQLFFWRAMNFLMSSGNE